MTRVAIREARSRLSELARLVEAGESVVITRNGAPVLEMVPYNARGGADFAAFRQYKREHGIDRSVEYIADDFDDPLPEDFLLRPLPE